MVGRFKKIKYIYFFFSSFWWGGGGGGVGGWREEGGQGRAGAFIRRQHASILYNIYLCTLTHIHCFDDWLRVYCLSSTRSH